MLSTLDLEDDRIYPESVICRALGVSPGVLAKARAAGRLRSFKAGRRRLYMSRWVREWIEQASELREAEVASC